MLLKWKRKKTVDSWQGRHGYRCPALNQIMSPLDNGRGNSGNCHTGKTVYSLRDGDTVQDMMRSLRTLSGTPRHWAVSLVMSWAGSACCHILTPRRSGSVWELGAVCSPPLGPEKEAAQRKYSPGSQGERCAHWVYDNARFERVVKARARPLRSKAGLQFTAALFTQVSAHFSWLRPARPFFIEQTSKTAIPM